MKEKIQSALLHLKIVRIVSSVKISSFENVSEHFILTYINQDENSHDMLPLPPMPRTTQRSLKVFDESGNELPVIPSYQVHDALMELSKDYLAGILNHVEIGRDMQEEIEILKNSFDEIFKYPKPTPFFMTQKYATHTEFSFIFYLLLLKYISF